MLLLSWQWYYVQWNWSAERPWEENHSCYSPPQPGQSGSHSSVRSHISTTAYQRCHLDTCTPIKINCRASNLHQDSGACVYKIKEVPDLRIGAVGHSTGCLSLLVTLCASLGWCCRSWPPITFLERADATPASLWTLLTDTLTQKTFVHECTSLQTMDVSVVSQLRSPLLRSCPQSRETWFDRLHASRILLTRIK